MKRPSRRFSLILAGLAALGGLLLLIAPQRPPARYTIRGVATDAGATSRATGLNNHGDVLGDVDAKTPDHRIFVEREGRLHYINVPEKDALPALINDAGDFLCQVGRTTLRMLLWRNGRWLEPSVQGHPLSGAGLAADGTVVGTAMYFEKTGSGSIFVHRAGLWRDGRATDITGPDFNGAYAMNGKGLVAGTHDMKPAIWQNGRVQPLPALPGHVMGMPAAINDRGQIAGIRLPAEPDYVTRACLWENGTVADLGSLGGDSMAASINASGQVVGHSVVRGAPRIDWSAWRTPAQALRFEKSLRATLFEDGQARDLNRLIPRGSGWLLEAATAINDKGQITGTGRYKGREHGFLLTPKE